MHMAKEDQRTWAWLRWAGWGGAVALVATPFVLMAVAPETSFDWSAGDFVLAAVAIGTLGLLAELTVRASANWSYRFGAAIGAVTGLLLIWSNLAVGYIGDGDAPINGFFLIIPIMVLLTAIVAKGRAGAMMWIMSAAAVAHGIAGIIGFPQDTRTGPITIVFVGLWLASAALFRNAARDCD
jgi:hypothetical protein